MQKIISLSILVILLSQIQFTEAAVTCQANEYSDGANCQACHETRQSAAGDDTPIASCVCQAGYASNANDNTACTPCAVGSYSNAGAQACTACHVSRTTANAQTTTVAGCVCKVGYFSDKTDNTACTQCEATRTTAAIDKKLIGDCVCKGGYASDKTDNTACTQCEVGKYAAQGSVTCTACHASRTTSAAGKSLVTDCLCKVGYFSDKTDNTACTQCEATRTTAAVGKTLVSECVCNAGYSSDKTDNTACTQCAANNWSAQGATTCTACTNSRTSPAGSTAVTACKCPGSTVTDDGTSTCQAESSFSLNIAVPLILLISVFFF